MELAFPRKSVLIEELELGSVNTDYGQQLMQFNCGSKTWVYLTNRYDGTVNRQSRAMTKRRLCEQLEATWCKANGDVICLGQA
ncbi:hypothetical protein BBJ28_00021222 [Nothophytophthora sp. Chile5]|nr:hypothetical protein BBJ28_00021222 [Nothophytophthora sp. Chile5]